MNKIQITYRELDENSNRLAHILMERGGQPDTIFGIRQSTPGGRLALLAPGDEKDPGKIIDMIERYAVSHINFVPSMFNVFTGVLAPGSIGRLSDLNCDEYDEYLTLTEDYNVKFNF